MSEAVNASELSFQFDSGARWDLCWSIDQHTGLQLHNVRYQPPGERATRVLQSASIAQILFKYDEDTDTEQLVSRFGLGGTNHVAADEQSCLRGVVHRRDQHAICVTGGFKNLLTSTRRNPSLHRHQWNVNAVSNIGSKSFEQIWRFSEDGMITPAVRVGGALSRFTNLHEYGSDVTVSGPLASNAMLLYSWRLDFDIGDSAEDDIVEQMQFVPEADGKRRIAVSSINVESGHSVNPELFRGWLVRDAMLSASADGDNRLGYFLDPQQSGFKYSDRRLEWPAHDFIVTRYNSCERLASGNHFGSDHCDDNLHQFVDQETLEQQNLVVWFNLARQFLPKKEDLRQIVPRESSFSLIPFDWSPASPFTDAE